MVNDTATVSKKAYSEMERERIRKELTERALALFKEKGIRDTGIEEIYVPIGISKTFFYSFFNSKIALIEEVYRLQTEDMMETLRSNIWDYGSENGLRETFRDMIDGRWYLASIDDQMYLRSNMTAEEFGGYMNDRIILCAEVLNLAGIQVNRLDPRVFYNMLMPIVWAGRSDPHSAPFLYTEAIGNSTEVQLDLLIGYMISLSVNAEMGSRNG